MVFTVGEIDSLNHEGELILRDASVELEGGEEPLEDELESVQPSATARQLRSEFFVLFRSVISEW